MIGSEFERKVGHESKSAPVRGEPDVSLCRAKAAGFGDYVDCMVSKPEMCLFALRFGAGHLCRHPERQEFVLKTKTLGHVQRV